jgi:hypothetical protein
LSGQWKRDERSGRWERPGAAAPLKIKVKPEARRDKRITGHFARPSVPKDPEIKHEESREENESQASIPDNRGAI